MSKHSNIAYNKRTNQFAPIAYTTTYENSKQVVHRTAKGTFTSWADGDVEFLSIHQVEKLIKSDDLWDDPSEETLKILGLTVIPVS